MAFFVLLSFTGKESKLAWFLLYGLQNTKFGGVYE